DEGSSVTYVENYFSQNETEKSVSNIVAEVYAHDNAYVSFGGVDHFAHGTTTYINRRGIVQNNAQLDWTLGQMNEGHTVTDNITVLMCNRLITNPRTVTVVLGNKTQNFTTTTRHYGLETDGVISQRGVMNEKTKAIYKAIGKIEDGATRENAEKESR